MFLSRSSAVPRRIKHSTRCALWVVNKLLHIVKSEALTDAGLPSEDDPTANEYELPSEFLDRTAT